MDVALSDADILSALRRIGVDSHVVEYRDICGMTLADLLPDDNPAVVYLATEPSFGHWTCAFQRKGEIEAWDSMGHLIDASLLEVSPEMRAELHETSPCLMELLMASGRPICWNTSDFQRCAPGVNTCGRWVVLRLSKRDLDDAEFKAWLDGQRQSGESYDALAVRLSRPLVGK